jgi:hypothetical protein
VVEILYVTATDWRGAADAEASMNPEDRDEARRLGALSMLRRSLANERKRLNAMNWLADGGPQAVAFLLAVETGGSDPLLEKWQELRRTTAASHPVPDPIELAARRLVVLLVETLSRTGLSKSEAREKAAKAVKRMFSKKAKRRKGQPSIWVDVDADAIRFWQSGYPTPTPDHEKLITDTLKRCGNDRPQIVGRFVKMIEFAIDPAAAWTARRASRIER